jgi:hypothetical protein
MAPEERFNPDATGRAFEDGMGEVWLAEQKEPVRRRVALKLLKAGMNTREVIAALTASARPWL